MALLHTATGLEGFISQQVYFVTGGVDFYSDRKYLVPLLKAYISRSSTVLAKPSLSVSSVNARQGVLALSV